ncbi:sigma-70 family RNA polymerase sigma factor [Desulfuromonas acetoxidans]|uniref:Sigma-70 region 4 n=1 Tax=Desulfuromonas acetoxidans (strain DSM 684 / 11070) TaxID=281689 RepID=Q1JX49_DESA6|nr:sigma-70 family RNA polymerase sigma factor [Desulfuromonas acetoxidans]EAT14813.1 sigma-70 region 4 [Desulfuromonas acetoxidans DSM 684]MBF0645307.1 sigma-70 family RNA polymerase sigma factor [Desulfuromonas acetoxidans]NVD25828.1 sigma-70 family RNA polymerase sigma factor [Desulfuromonas acetoxidans]NVE17806.1 sigma-70 family RNA polymerase sigma factor [Desulfuromonas acetoxidans]
MSFEAMSGFSPQESSLIQRIAQEVFFKYNLQGFEHSISREDLCHYGVVGLLEARVSYDERSGTPWLAFAALRVRGEMIDHLRKLPMVRLPQAVQSRVKQLKEARRALQTQQIEVDHQHLSTALDWTLDEVREVEALLPRRVAVDDGVDQGGDELPSAVTVTSDGPSPETQALQFELAMLINRCLQRLSAQNRLIVVGRLLEGLKLKELAATLGYTAENIRVRQKKSQEQLKSCIEKHGWPVDALDEIIGEH